ncbi:MAG TPA: PDZ domain-containing protein [Streptosporangiaceae bacterium]|nr:PDZ domain-containing protein [Streptosporangiaceae bacterium]
MSRRSLTLLIASVGTAVAIAVSVLVPVPYVILGPGPTLNTLGKDSSGQPLITISGHASYPTTGHLNLVTVSYQGCAGNRFNIFTALVAWLNPHQAVVPEGEICPAGQTQKQTQEQDTQEMTSSQSTATAAALTQLHIPYSTQVVVVQPQQGFPAYGVLKAGDVITKVDGQPVTSQGGLTRLIYAHPAGSTLTLTIIRDGQSRQVQVGTRQSGGHPVMGVQITEQYKFPFQVKISVGDIGGPSAGMMFSLGIIDKLTKLDLTAGRFIAGTGEITARGQVQPIGGIQQKMVGARNAGATIFLTPASNCADTKGAVPAGLRLVKVSTLNQAVTYLEALKSGHPNSVPSC